MRYMIINKVDADSEAGKFPAPAVIEGVGQVVEDLSKAGVLLFAEGVHRSSLGARVQVADGRRTVTDGPFAETKELVGGVMVVDVRSREEAVEWAARLAEALGSEVEVRRVVEEADFAPDSDVFSVPTNG
ncbi:YciI family protein [Kribbella sp. NBC_01505]|uniref:YciI family protein n=1 Tax=Kribbella sp. NBC_01505 TaxID=2903580 RepID=UPI00386CD855